MIPPLIVRRAQELGLGMIAITDHNTAENVAAVQRAAPAGLVVIPGMELQTREEVHILCLFDTLDQALTWQVVVYANLPPLENRADVFGAQLVVDEAGDFIRMNNRLLLTSTALSVEEAVSGVRELGGLPIAAHVDRPSFSLLANLGFIPPGLDLGALEISHRVSPGEFLAQNPHLSAAAGAHAQGWPLIVSGDAHRLSEMRAATLITMRFGPESWVQELELAFRGEGGRKVELLA